MRFPDFSFQAVRRLALVVFLLTFCGVHTFAGVVTFTGEDLNAGPGNPTPSSSAAAASFATAAGGIGTIATINFESAALGSFTSLVVAPGVTLSAVTSASINNTPNFPTNPALDGFNTTPGGANYVESLGRILTFTFSTPTQFFGVWLTGTQINFFQDTVTFNDGAAQTINAVQTGTDGSHGAVNFVGFTDAGKSITSVTVTSGNGSGGDFIGIDDVSYQTTASSVPEPGSLGIVVACLLGFGIAYRRRRANRA
jgi:hypothetical protein